MFDLFNTSSNIGDFPSNTSNYAYRVYDKCLEETKDSLNPELEAAFKSMLYQKTIEQDLYTKE